MFTGKKDVFVLGLIAGELDGEFVSVVVFALKEMDVGESFHFWWVSFFINYGNFWGFVKEACMRFAHDEG